MSNLSTLISVPELEDDEFVSTGFLFHTAKNNVRVLWNVIHFYFQDSNKNDEQITDVASITELLENFYFDFFFYEIEARFIDEPVEIESLIRSHLKEIVMINDRLNDFLDKLNSIKEVNSVLLDLQRVLGLVVESFSFFCPEQFVLQNRQEQSPFKDAKTKDLFDYIVKNWSNNSASKWGYIWEFLFTKDNGKLTNKTDYESYVRKYHNFTSGKPNYESCNSAKRYLELDELKQGYLDSLDLN